MASSKGLKKRRNIIDAAKLDRIQSLIDFKVPKVEQSAN
jgi:hypothetical protein